MKISKPGGWMEPPCFREISTDLNIKNVQFCEIFLTHKNPSANSNQSKKQVISLVTVLFAYEY